MTPSEAFEVLGLPPDADATTIKRAYHKLLKRHKPDRDPEGFRRIREAFEVAMTPSFGDAPLDPDDEGLSRAHRVDAESEELDLPVLPNGLDSDAVHHALDHRRVLRAHAMVMDRRWIRAMVGEGHETLRSATRRVGLATALDHREAFDALARAHPSLFDEPDPKLARLLALGPQWEQLRTNAALPDEISAFFSQFAAANVENRRGLARRLARWFWGNMPLAEQFAEVIWQHHPSLGPHFMSALRSFDDEIETTGTRVPLSPVPHPKRMVRRASVWVRRLLLVPVVFVIATAFPATPLERLLVGLAAGAALLLLTRRPMKEDQVKQRSDLLRGCLFHDVSPVAVAQGIRWDQDQRTRIESDIELETCYRMGRLARLGLDDAAPPPPPPEKRRRAGT